MIIQIIVTIVAILAIAGLIYYLKMRQKKGDYIWVGHGDDPFKED